MKLTAGRSRSALACLSLTGALALAIPAMAQNTSGGATQQGQYKTGEGPRGSKAGPSTDPGLAGHGPTSSPASKTGVGQRGSPVGPSTEHPAHDSK